MEMIAHNIFIFFIFPDEIFHTLDIFLQGIFIKQTYLNSFRGIGKSALKKFFGNKIFSAIIAAQILMNVP